MSEAFFELARELGFEVWPHDDDDDVITALHRFYGANQARLQDGSKNGGDMVVDVFVLDHPDLNAFAVSLPDEDVIALFKGMFPLLKNTMRGLVNNGLFASGGISDDNPPFQFAIPARSAVYGHSYNELPKLAKPKHEELASDLYGLTVQYILSHELAHIYNGHCDWAGQRQRLALISEMSSEKIGVHSGLERETLEWDADCWAIQHLLQIVLHPDVQIVDGISAWSLKESPWGPIDHALKMVLVAVLTCARFWSLNDSSDYTDPTPREHPHPYFRALTAFGQIDHVLYFRTGQKHTQMVARVWNETMDAFASSWMELFPEAAKEPAFLADPAIHDVYTSRLKDYARTWAAMHDELDRVKRGGRLAPAIPKPHPAYPARDVSG
ncbi:hypothetical protein HNO88_002942 [Novosphingobium chloroacetimidivorans]|uniref:Uncharacterized protein n=1 Tax=Novosphingobium chloroacetimidivorans TaxID=1428314 RepID=A0A7W7NWI5_9SPHN|nr:M48 family metalloprotease [Novosphingobium chloroacetimidivorans]MBB4859613.1 hypothetical protein [Novosphingobium chloroacetimidivorans]